MFLLIRLFHSELGAKGAGGGADQAFKEEKKGQQGGSTQTVSFITQAKWILAIHSIAFIAFPLNSKLETRTSTFVMLINTEI